MVRGGTAQGIPRKEVINKSVNAELVQAPKFTSQSTVPVTSLAYARREEETREPRTPSERTPSAGIAQSFVLRALYLSSAR